MSSTVVARTYAGGKGVAKVGHVVWKNRGGKPGPEKFLVIATPPNSSFVEIMIIGNNKLMDYQESVPASDLWLVGEAEIKVSKP